MLSKPITVNPYVTELYFLKGSPDELAKDIKKLTRILSKAHTEKVDLKFPIGNYAANTEEYLIDGFHYIVLAVNTTENDNQAYLVDTIAHEAIHVLTRIFKHASIQLDLVNDEPQAYLTGWVAGELYKFVTKLEKTRRNDNKN